MQLLHLLLLLNDDRDPGIVPSQQQTMEYRPANIEL
jgi:hypothetical protein